MISSDSIFGLYRKFYTSLLCCNDEDQAMSVFDDFVETYIQVMREAGKELSLANARSLAQNNLGWYTGELPEAKAAAKKMYELLGISHPIFGNPKGWVDSSMDDLFQLGVDWVKNNPEP